MSKTTKEDILIVALHLFARDGYEAVSVSQIAGELGMTKGALYRHYESKRDIFEHIVKKMEQGDGEQAGEYDMPVDKKENEPEQYEEISTDNFVEYSKSMFSYWTENDFASSFRKMLTLEQFRNEEMQALYEIHFIIEHYNSYKQMPDKLTFLGRFKDFQMLEVTESTDYLVYKLKEAYTYRRDVRRS